MFYNNKNSVLTKRFLVIIISSSLTAVLFVMLKQVCKEIVKMSCCFFGLFDFIRIEFIRIHGDLGVFLRRSTVSVTEEVQVWKYPRNWIPESSFRKQGIKVPQEYGIEDQEDNSQSVMEDPLEPI